MAKSWPVESTRQSTPWEGKPLACGLVEDTRPLSVTDLVESWCLDQTLAHRPAPDPENSSSHARLKRRGREGGGCALELPSILDVHGMASQIGLLVANREPEIGGGTSHRAAEARCSDNRNC